MNIKLKTKHMSEPVDFQEITKLHTYIDEKEYCFGFVNQDGYSYHVKVSNITDLIITDKCLQRIKVAQWVPDSLCKHKPSRIRNTDRWTIYHCSCCGHSNGRRFNDKFCSNCGAKMILKTQGGDD